MREAIRPLGEVAAPVVKGSHDVLIGPAIVQLARNFGATVTGVCGTARLAFVKSLGAHSVIDYTHEDFVDRPDTYDVVNTG